MTTIAKAPIDGIKVRTIPRAWRDLSRDWNCWSMAERALAVVMVASAPILPLTIVCALG
ncbi:MAG TPA: hypothetical protein VGU20_27440 [Stellaceae bacterium]|nr:hypothetical protein [Stellaceae bacterium]